MERTIRLLRATGDPSVETIVTLLLDPPSREEAIEDAERLVFAG